jgi:hypothetical protein
MKVISIVSFMFFSIHVFSQSKVNKLSGEIIFSFAQSYFEPNTILDYRIRCPELKAGIVLRKQLGRFGIVMGAIPGIRLETRQPSMILPHPAVSGELLQDYMFLQSAKRSYSRQRLFVEFPIAADYALSKRKLFLQSGISARYFQTDESDRPRMCASEFGLLFRIKWYPMKDLGVSVDYFKALSDSADDIYYYAARQYRVDGSYFQVSMYFPIKVLSRDY